MSLAGPMRFGKWVRFVFIVDLRAVPGWLHFFVRLCMCTIQEWARVTTFRFIRRAAVLFPRSPSLSFVSEFSNIGRCQARVLVCCYWWVCVCALFFVAFVGGGKAVNRAKPGPAPRFNCFNYKCLRQQPLPPVWCLPAGPRWQLKQRLCCTACTGRCAGGGLMAKGDAFMVS